MVKSNAWEDVIQKDLKTMRVKEKAYFIYIFFLQSIVQGISSFLPHICGFCTFMLFSILYPEELTVAKVFTLISVFNSLIHPTRCFMFAITNRVAG